MDLECGALRPGDGEGLFIDEVCPQTVVLPSGEIIKTRQRARKSSAGWDATKL
jgi:hypothetical protein